MTAAAPAPKTINRTQIVHVAPMQLAQGDTVATKVTVTNPQSDVARFWSRTAVAKTVRKGIDGDYQSSYQVQGFSCTPMIRGETTSFTCKLRGADVPTIVTLKFNVVYRGDTASG